MTIYLPDKSIFASDDAAYDYVDCFHADFSGQVAVGIVEIGQAFFSSEPKWVLDLMALRNKVVTVFGLKTAGVAAHHQEQYGNLNFQPGKQIGLFKVYAKAENEVVLGQDDKHLNFRVSLLLESPGVNRKRVTVTTIVKFNYWFGRLYFIPIGYFHRLIVPAMLKAMIKRLEEKNDIRTAIKTAI